MAENFPVAWSSSHVTANNVLGTSPSQIVGNNGQRVAITFHNPGTVNIYVYSSQISPAPGLGNLGGTYVVFPGGDITIYGGNVMSISAVNGPWSAFAASASNNPLTIMEMVQ